MARKTYTEEFRRRAVDLYETTPGATVRGIAEDLGITRGTLRQWLVLHGAGRKTGADGMPAGSPLKSGAGSWATSSAPGTQESQAEAIARLEAENRDLRAQTAKLTVEREILRQAAKYFAGETKWPTASSSSRITRAPGA